MRATRLLPLVLTVSIVACERPGPPFVESVSPGGAYRVVVSGLPDAPKGRMFIEHKARLSVSKGAEKIVSDREIHFADWMDSGFNDEFGPHEWMQETVFRFESTGAKRPHLVDRVFVQNRADKRVRFLRIVAKDMLFVFDVESGAQSSLPVTGQPRLESGASGQTTGSWIAADGVWEDGMEIGFAEKNFLDLPADTSQVYAVTVSNAGLAIEIRKFD